MKCDNLSKGFDSRAETEKLLLVEGPNDCHAIAQISWIVYSADPIFGIHECGNDNKVLESLSARLVATEPKQKILGLVLDSDIHGISPELVIQARLDQLKYRVNQYYDVPTQFPEAGLILEPRQERPDAARLPKLGVWLMPDNRVYGMFEDLLRDSLAESVRTYTENVVSQAKADLIARYRDTHKSKAVIRTYMAWQDPPDIQYLGLAIKNRVFPELEAKCKSFVSWLETLYGKPNTAQTESIT